MAMLSFANKIPLIHIKPMSKDLVYSTGKSTQCSVVK